jgi:hypothetical protein
LQRTGNYIQYIVKIFRPWGGKRDKVYCLETRYVMMLHELSAAAMEASPVQ